MSVCIGSEQLIIPLSVSHIIAVTLLEKKSQFIAFISNQIEKFYRFCLPKSFISCMNKKLFIKLFFGVSSDINYWIFLISHSSHFISNARLERCHEDEKKLACRLFG